MAVVLAEGVVEITGDATGVGRSIVSDVEKSSGAATAAGTSVGKSVFGGIVKGFALLGGASLLANFFVGAIKGSSNLNETISKSNVIFGTSAKTIDRWGDTAAKKLGLSESKAIDAAAGFGNMFTQLGFASDAAADMSMKTVQMSADLGSFNNLGTEDVADRISAAFRGEYDSLQALIPNINAARVEQEAMSMTGKTLTSDLTAQEKAAAVLAIVTRDGAAAMGDFERTSDGAAGKQKIMTAAFEDQQSKLGTILMPIWTDFMGFLTDTAIPTLGIVVDWIKDNTYWLGPLATAIGAATAAMWLFNASMTANPFGLVVAGIVWVVAQGWWLATNWGLIMGSAERAGRNFAREFSSQISGVIGIVNALIRVIAIVTAGIDNILKKGAAIANVGIMPGGISGGSVPAFATGSTNTPDTFIAGENGPELITGARGATVHNAFDTREILGRRRGGTTNVYLKQDVYSTDPILGARQSAREVSRYLGV